MSKISFIGLGVMGFPMAGYISKAGHDVTVYNRTKTKADKWVKEYKGKSADTPMDAAKDSDFIFTCVGNDNDLREVTLGDKGLFKTDLSSFKSFIFKKFIISSICALESSHPFVKAPDSSFLPLPNNSFTDFSPNLDFLSIDLEIC